MVNNSLLHNMCITDPFSKKLEKNFFRFKILLRYHKFYPKICLRTSTPPYYKLPPVYAKRKYDEAPQGGWRATSNKYKIKNEGCG